MRYFDFMAPKGRSPGQPTESAEGTMPLSGQWRLRSRFRRSDAQRCRRVLLVRTNVKQRQPYEQRPPAHHGSPAFLHTQTRPASTRRANPCKPPQANSDSIPVALKWSTVCWAVCSKMQQVLLYRVWKRLQFTTSDSIAVPVQKAACLSMLHLRIQRDVYRTFAVIRTRRVSDLHPDPHIDPLHSTTSNPCLFQLSYIYICIQVSKVNKSRSMISSGTEDALFALNKYFALANPLKRDWRAPIPTISDSKCSDTPTGSATVQSSTPQAVSEFRNDLYRYKPYEFEDPVNGYPEATAKL